MANPRDNGRAEQKFIDPPTVRRALTKPEDRLRAWTDLRNAWFQSGFTGVDPVTGGPLPKLGPRPPDPPRKPGKSYTRGARK